MSAADYSAIYQNAGQQYGIDPALLMAQGDAESGGNPNAVSPAGATGIAQIMPTTAKNLGVDPSDPSQAIYGQAKLMAENIKRYGDTKTALMAYHGGTDPKNWGTKTQNYANKIMANYQGNTDPFDQVSGELQNAQQVTPATTTPNSNTQSNVDPFAQVLGEQSQQKQVEAKKAEIPKPTYLQDLGNTAIGSTIPRAILGTVMAPANVGNLAWKGAGYLGEKAYNALTGNQVSPEVHKALSTNPLYSSEDVYQFLGRNNLAPTPYTPQYTANKYLDTAGQFVLAGKGANLANGATSPSVLSLAAGGAGAEAAHQFLPDSELAPIIGALGAGGVVAAGKGILESPGTKQIIADNDAARLDTWNNLKKSPQDLENAINQRDAVITPLREQAFANKQPVDPNPIMEKINNVLSGPGRNRTSVVNSMNAVKDMMTENDGSLITDPEVLYESVKKGIGDMLDAKNPNNAGNLNASRELMQVKNVVDDTIEQGAPGYKNYNDVYSQMSQPINEMSYLQKLKLLSNGKLNLSKVDNAFNAATIKQQFAKVTDPANSLSDATMQTLQKLRDDLLNEKTNLQNIKPEQGNLPANMAASSIGALHPALGGTIFAGKTLLNFAKRNKLNNALVSSFRPSASSTSLLDAYKNHLIGMTLPSSLPARTTGQ